MNINDIKPRNNKNEKHGYWKIYRPDGNLWYKGNFINGKQSGYWELFLRSGHFKEYYIL